MNVSNILNGWQNFIHKSEVTEKVALDRAKHCLRCEHKLFSKTLKAFVKDELIQVEGFICKKCKCPLSAKLRSEKEKCPLKLW